MYGLHSSLVHATCMWVYVFMHSRFVVSRTFNDMLTERLQQKMVI